MIINKLNKKRGFTLVEMLIYILGFVLVLSVIVLLLSSMLRLYREVKVSQELESALQISLDRITREVRDASSVDLGQSSIGANPGILFLNTTDVAGAPKTVRIYLDASDDVIYIDENGSLSGPLTSDKVEITDLTFNTINTGLSTAVRIKISGVSSNGNTIKSDTFYDAVILRGSY